MIEARSLEVLRAYADMPGIPPDLRKALQDAIRVLHPRPTVPSTAPELERFWAAVKKTGECWLWQRALKDNGYGQFAVQGVPRYAHRIAYELANGPILPGLVVDHICHVRHCVKPEHLRAITSKQNNENRPLLSGSSSGYRGVSWDQHKQKWRAAVSQHNHKIKVGSFDDAEEALAAVIQARNNLHTHNDSDQSFIQR